jgi:hypothetical protein
VVVLIDGVVKLAPVCKDDPPVELLYQFIVPLLALAPNATVPASHLDNGVVPLIVGTVFTVATIAVLDEEVHPLLVAST